MNSIAIVVYSLVVSCTYFSNKFVLTYLGKSFWKKRQEKQRKNILVCSLQDSDFPWFFKAG